MPISSRLFVRSTALLLLVGFIALAAIVGTTIFLVERSQTYFADVMEARNVRQATVDLRNALQNAETGQRGYLLTLDPEYLTPYREAVGSIDGYIVGLRDELAHYPEMGAPLDTLESDIRTKMAELEQTIALAQAGQAGQAIAIVRSDAGKAAMDAARAMFTQIIDDADARLHEAVDIQRNTGSALRWVSVGGGLLIFGVVGAFALTVVSYTRALVSARAQVEGVNAGLESRVAERTQDLGRANEEIQRFAYIVTHDLRAPLVNIMGFTSELEASVVALTNYMAERDEPGNVKFAEAKLAATEDLPEAITFIRAATKKMDRLINAILKISREGRRQLRPEPINLEEMINASVAAIQHQVNDHGGELVTNVAVPRLVSDRMSLEHVLGNLLDNAVKYSEPSRPLRIEVRARPVTGNRIEIEVEDNGRGIAASDHERVFELFRRSGLPDQTGEGIGLPHVRTMARSLGGDVTLRSELGVGTKFTVSLPRDLRSHLGSQKQ